MHGSHLGTALKCTSKCTPIFCRDRLGTNATKRWNKKREGVFCQRSFARGATWLSPERMLHRLLSLCDTRADICESLPHVLSLSWQSSSCPLVCVPSLSWSFVVLIEEVETQQTTRAASCFAPCRDHSRGTSPERRRSDRRGTAGASLRNPFV